MSPASPFMFCFLLPLLHFFLLLLLLVPIPSGAQTDGSIPVGSSLTAKNDSSPWLSPSGDFAFGFHSLPASNNGSNGNGEPFLLSIWYNKIPSRTIVWYANGDRPVPVDSKVELDSSMGIVLTDPQGKEIWKTEPIVGSTVSQAILNDTGNFVVLGPKSESLWESFEYPADTLLPGQTLRKGQNLSSRRSEEKFSTGKFQLRMQDDGNAVLNTINLPSNFSNDAYYSTNTPASDVSSPGRELVFNDSAVFLLRENGTTLVLSQGQANFYQRLTLSFDGVLTHYIHPKNLSSGGSWRIWRSIPDNICIATVSDGVGVCGYNSICTLTPENRSSCACPEKYTLLDPSDSNGSCVPNFTLSCGKVQQEKPNLSAEEDLYDLVESPNTDWPTSDYTRLEPFTEDECRNSCLHDCMCSVAIFGDGKTCRKKKLPLSNGRMDPYFNGKALIKVPKGDLLIPDNPQPPNREEKKYPKTLVLVVSVLLGISGFINILLLGAICVGFFVIYHRKKPPREGMVETNLPCFTYQELSRATDGFKEELGRGAFGIVYKGVLFGTTAVAVKKLTSVKQDTEKEFKAEVNVIGQIHHRNLVRLLGFCAEEPERLLVYEFMSNGTLSSLLFAGERKLSWSQRCQIALGVAKGLRYLHEECATQIIHCDIKPQNILLDDCYNARISDFGLAKLLKINQSRTQTLIRGTRGYVAPEWFRNSAITTKVDVYSYGVMLLEIICCKSSLIAAREAHQGDSIDAPILTGWAYDCFSKGELDALVEGDSQALGDREKLRNLVMIALWCIQEDPNLRPTIKKVIQMMEGAVEVPNPPRPLPSYM